MANLNFMRGSHATLHSAGFAIQDGAFYLTKDTHRLYAGIGTELVDLNRYIRTAASIEELKQLPNKELGDFAYVEGLNILAVYQEVDGVKQWVQINVNTDQKNTGVIFSGSGNTDQATLKITITDSDGTQGIEDTIQFIGSQGIDTSIDAEGNITIKGCTYTIDTALAGEVFTVSLNTSDDEVQGSSFALKAGENVTFGATGDELTITAKDTVLAAAGHTFTANAAGGAQVQIKDSSGNTATATLADGELFYKVGAGETKQTVVNKGELPVYTITEIDDMMKGLNPMRYLGPVASAAALTGKTNVAQGDTYMASSSFNISTITGEDMSCKIGDLFIATGEETNGVIANPVWTYIPAGDDSQTDTLYKGVADTAEHKLTITDSNNNAVAAIDVDVDGKITASSQAVELSEGGKGLKVTLGHAAPGAADSSKQSTTDDNVNVYEFNTVSAVTVDSTGHVSDVDTTKVIVPKAQLSGATVTSSENVATVVDTLKDTAGTALGTSTFSISTIAQDNLKVTHSGTTIALSLEWGEF